MPEYYEIKVGGQLDPNWSESFAGMKLTYLEGKETLFSGSLPDQAALHGLLERVRDLNLTLISVARGDPPAQPSVQESCPDARRTVGEQAQKQDGKQEAST
jgi:hypothetical protein